MIVSSPLVISSLDDTIVYDHVPSYFLQFLYHVPTWLFALSNEISLFRQRGKEIPNVVKTLNWLVKRFYFSTGGWCQRGKEIKKLRA